MLNVYQLSKLAQHGVAECPQLALSFQDARQARLTILDPALGGERDLALLDLQRHFGLAVQDVDKLVISTDKITKRGDRITQLDLPEPGGRLGEEQKTLPKIVAGIEHEARRP